LAYVRTTKFQADNEGQDIKMYQQNAPGNNIYIYIYWKWYYYRYLRYYKLYANSLETVLLQGRVVSIFTGNSVPRVFVCW
jgi:hypothetical protein